MKLAFSPASPYVRKVMACAVARGIDGQIEKWVIPSTDAALVPANPLSKVPTLVLADGKSLFDSPVICEYLDSLGSAKPLFPAAGPARWAALRQQAIGDGILDASQPRRREIALPQDEGRIGYIQLQQGKVKNSLADLEKDAANLNKLDTIGEIAIAWRSTPDARNDMRQAVWVKRSFWACRSSQAPPWPTPRPACLATNRLKAPTAQN